MTHSPSLVALLILVSGARSAAGQVEGRVRYEGPRPPSEVLDLTSDPDCDAIADDRAANHTLVGPDGGLKNVFVYVDAPPANVRPELKKTKVVLDQRGCRYAPRVFGIQVGQTLEIRNSDPTVHNVHAYVFRGFNVITPHRGHTATKVFRRPKVMVPLRCDVHPWMRAYAGVLPHPFFAVTDAKGRFLLPRGLPEGDHRLKLWHEKLGRRSAKLTVEDGQAQVEVLIHPQKSSR